MSASKPQESGKVRIRPFLNRNEQEFVARRRNTVLQSLKKLRIQCSRDAVPNIALLGSGGGQRAMVGLLGSLVQLDKAGLLDCILYLSGVSGSTWCMASLYQEPDWSTKLETVKDKIIRRISGPGVSLKDKLAKLKKYYYGKDHFSLTDVWAVMVITSYVKEIDEHALTEQWNQHNKDPFPIYAVIDKQCKQYNNEDPWFEINPHEAGYSLIGAFVDTCNFGSQFHEGTKINHQEEFDMLYLQALCGSALADEVDIKKVKWQKIKERSEHEFPSDDPVSPPVDQCYRVLMDLVDRNLSVLNGEDPSALDESIRTKLKVLSCGKIQLVPMAKETSDKRANKHFTLDVCNDLSNLIDIWPFDAWISICKCMDYWIWGRNYNFLHNMRDEAVPAALLESETRDYIDAGLLLNSPYFSVLREERDIDLIISLDFSESDPLMTVREAADMCRKQNIPFPEVNIPSEDVKKPKDFYVFTGKNTPTVIHIPLFNVVNCGDEIEAWRIKYRTFQGSYSAEMITDLMEVAGKNISNNREKLLEQIQAVIQKKIFRRFNNSGCSLI
uniref:PLA2c domain-containing protein n=1 Tax=Cyprinus carpio TaxID=7962 RepID=A0A8C1WJI4_CYPCA